MKSTNDKYILGGEDDHQVIPCEDLLEWGRWYETHDRRVKQEYIGPYHVSTVFLALDHNFVRLFAEHGPDPAPLLFETMVFHVIGHVDNVEIQERCSTWDQAIKQHDRIAAEIRKTVVG